MTELEPIPSVEGIECPECGVIFGPCMTKGGNPRKPHEKRLTEAEYYVDEDGEEYFLSPVGEDKGAGSLTPQEIEEALEAGEDAREGLPTDLPATEREQSEDEGEGELFDPPVPPRRRFSSRTMMRGGRR